MKKIILLIIIGLQQLISGTVFPYTQCCMSGEAEADTILEEQIIKEDVLMKHFENQVWIIDTHTPENGYGYTYKTATDTCEGEGVFGWKEE